MTTPEEIEEIHRIRRELKKEFPTHVLKQINRVEQELEVLRERVNQLIKLLEIIPIEFVVRNIATGSLTKRLGIPDGTVLSKPLIEYSYKNDELGDPLIAKEHILEFKWASEEELEFINDSCLRINDFMQGMFRGVGIKLVDFKLEFGRVTIDGKKEIILADEINRAPSKVQSALLESMQERQVTIGEETFKLDPPFLVLATQNPIEQEGTYPLPEAQVDRFMLKVLVDYPSIDEEKEILDKVAKTNLDTKLKSIVNCKKVLDTQSLVNEIHISPKILDYILNIVFATRNPEKYKLTNLKDLINFGASPRASINLVLAAKANAFINGRGYVIPEDIRYIGKDILRHRILLSYEAEAEEITSEEVIDQLFKEISVP